MCYMNSRLTHQIGLQVLRTSSYSNNKAWPLSLFRILSIENLAGLNKAHLTFHLGCNIAVLRVLVQRAAYFRHLVQVLELAKGKAQRLDEPSKFRQDLRAFHPLCMKVTNRTHLYLEVSTPLVNQQQL